MIGESQGAHFQFFSSAHQPIDAAGSVEQTKVGVDVEVAETGIAGHLLGKAERLRSEKLKWLERTKKERENEKDG